jgi:2-dehydro-3-deoxyphosphogluconate aldolase/(4S)-4-hydroxy-2-oxoglutarate aldolase
MNEVLKKLGDFGVVPVIALTKAADALPLGEALLEGGLPCAEITFRTEAAGEAIQALTQKYPEITVGAGTVLTTEQAQRAIAAGASFVVSPGFDARIVDLCIEREIPITPGVATPTEINMALDRGLTILKFFPAEALGGVKTLKAIAAPYGGVKFIPTGGVSLENLGSYLSLPAVHCCGGSWLVKRALIDAGDFTEIVRLVREAVDIVHQIRQG